MTERADARVFDGFVSLQTPSTWRVGNFVGGFFNPQPYAVGVLLVVVAALWQGRVRTAVAVAVVCLGANVTTQALKQLTAAPREPAWLPDVSWPSGHLTAATSLALCVVLVAPVALRRYAVVAGALMVIATAYSILVIGSHHPSDVAGGMLVAGAWTGLAVAALERGRPATAAPPWRRRLAPAAAALSAVVLLVVVLALAPLGPALDGRTTFLAGALLLAACAAAIPAAVATLARGS